MSVLVSVRVLFYITIIMYYVGRCEKRENNLTFSSQFFFRVGVIIYIEYVVYNTVVTITIKSCTFLPTTVAEVVGWFHEK